MGGEALRPRFFSLLGHLFRTVRDSLLMLIGLALLSTGLAVAATYFLVQLINAYAPDADGAWENAWLGVILLPFFVAHAIFLIIACRKVARHTPGYRLPTMTLGRWVFSVSVLALILMAATSAAAMSTLPGVFSAIVLLAALFAWLPLLPRLCLYDRRTASARFLPTMLLAVGLSIPFLLLTELSGIPGQTCVDECWGLMEGGVIMLPLFGLHTFLASVTAASVSAVAYSAQIVAPRPSGEAG